MSICKTFPLEIKLLIGKKGVNCVNNFTLQYKCCQELSSKKEFVIKKTMPKPRASQIFEFSQLSLEL